MNQPYVKEYLRNEEGDFILDEKGYKIVTNPLTKDYISYYPNKRQVNEMKRRNKFNCRKGRNYYQLRMKPIYKETVDVNTGEISRLILYSIPAGTTIQHKVSKLPRKG